MRKNLNVIYEVLYILLVQIKLNRFDIINICSIYQAKKHYSF